MKRFFKLANLAFYFLMLIVFFFIGIYVAGFVGAGKNQMLAGGAIVVGWGVMFAFVAFISSFFIAYFVEHKYIVRLNWVLLVLLIMLYGITHLRYLERQKEKEREKEREKIGLLQQIENQLFSTAEASMIYENSDFKENAENIENNSAQTIISERSNGAFVCR